MITSILPVIGTLISCPMVAYSITKIPWKGGKYLFPIILMTMMIPSMVTQIPMYATWSKLGMLNTFIPLVLPSFFGSTYYIYLFRQFMKSLPTSVIEAARIDGAGDFRILYSIVYPMCSSILTTVAVMVFIACWNDYVGPLMYLQDSKLYTLGIGLQMFKNAAQPE
ncbi:MAG: carbohydrate ABC transporter permease [Gallintestinimicrobium sp.]